MTRLKRLSAVWIAVAVALLGVGCLREKTCIEGASLACACTDGRAGAQLCRSDGTLASCVCLGDSAVADASSDAVAADAIATDSSGEASASDAIAVDGTTDASEVAVEDASSPEAAVVDVVAEDATIDAGDSALSDAARADADVTCAPPPTSPRVLLYGPGGTAEQPFLPASASVTVASAAMWSAMSAADFASFDMIVIGDSFGSINAAQLQTAFDTRATWGSVIRGRIVVSALDVGLHAVSPPGHPPPGAAVFARTALAWVAAGEGTGLYASTDRGSRGLDYLSALGAFADLPYDSDAINVTMPSHPILMGSSTASLSGWGNSGHARITMFPPSFQRLANLGPTMDAALIARGSIVCEP